VTSGIEQAVEILRAGGLVAFPTETVYGLGADAANPGAVRRIYEVKHRPGGHPLIVHIGSAGQLGTWAREITPTAAALARAFWPGPLTLLLGRQTGVSDVVTGGLDTIGVRVPAHPLALELLHTFGGGIAAPSANRFGRVSPTTAEHVRADLGREVDLILDGGACDVGLESTIVDVTVEPPAILRAGGVAAESIAAIVGGPLDDSSIEAGRAPGTLASHYAPNASIEVVDDATIGSARVTELEAAGRRAELLDPGPDSNRYAHGLYHWLRDADERAVQVLVIVQPPAGGLGSAIRDRLRKASAPRASHRELLEGAT
jgi:L-threonylcarbamoyladenylate synthase